MTVATKCVFSFRQNTVRIVMERNEPARQDEQKREQFYLTTCCLSDKSADLRSLSCTALKLVVRTDSVSEVQPSNSSTFLDWPWTQSAAASNIWLQQRLCFAVCVSISIIIIVVVIRKKEIRNAKPMSLTIMRWYCRRLRTFVDHQ